MTSKIKSINVKAILFLFIALSGLVFLSGCGEDPKREDVPELLTKVTLTFMPEAGSGSSVVEVYASDSDGNGNQDLLVSGPINLDKDIEYTLTLTLINEFAEPTEEEYDITAEIEEEGDEHQFFFSWTAGVFSNPTLTGNIIDINNPTAPLSNVNYVDVDVNGRPVGLETIWEAGANIVSGGAFRVILKHQPDGAKSATSNSQTGGEDLDVSFVINIQ